MYWNECVKNPITVLFGNGLISEEVFIPSQNITRTSHNLYLFLFYRFGFVGCIALSVGFYFIVKTLSKNKTNFILSMPLIWYLLVSFADNTFLCFNITFLPISLLFMFEHNFNTSENKTKSETNINILNKNTKDEK